MSVLKFPVLSSTSLSGYRYISPNGVAYFWDGYSWNSSSVNAGPSPVSRNPFLYRTIYTRGYVHCGYQNSSPWKNTNRTVHATDVTTNLGDMFDYNSCYLNGGFSDYYTYLFSHGSQGAIWNGSSNLVSTMNMITETYRAYSSTRYMTVSRQDTKVLMNPGLTIIYITCGGSSNTDKFSTITDSMLAADSAPANPAGAGYSGVYYCATGFFGQYRGTIGWYYGSASLDFANEVWTNGTWSFSSNCDGVAKGLSSKWGYGYNATTNVTNTFYKFNDTTLSQITTIGRPEACGEENMQIGQDWGYGLGSYDGAQTNNTFKQYYTSDTCVALGSDGQPKGHGGMSSGSCGTGSATLLGGIMGESI